LVRRGSENPLAILRELALKFYMMQGVEEGTIPNRICVWLSDGKAAGYAGRYLISAIALAILFLSGCCVRVAASVRNETGRDIRLTIVRYSGETNTVEIKAGSAALVAGIMPNLDWPPDSWVVTDGQAVFTFADVSPIAAMPDAFISRSRFTSDFPCRRVTQHVRIASDMTIHAVRVIGYTKIEPVSFPIRCANKQAE
jgi:hypothetical protein